MNKVFPALAATIALAAAAPAAHADIVTPCPAGTDPGTAQAVQWLATQTTTPVSCIPITAAQVPQIQAPAIVAPVTTQLAATPAAAPAAPRAKTSKLRAGEFCSRAKQRTYRRAGFTCRKASDGRYRLRHS